MSASKSWRILSKRLREDQARKARQKATAFNPEHDIPDAPIQPIEIADTPRETEREVTNHTPNEPDRRGPIVCMTAHDFLYGDRHQRLYFNLGVYLRNADIDEFVATLREGVDTVEMRDRLGLKHRGDVLFAILLCYFAKRDGLVDLPGIKLTVPPELLANLPTYESQWQHRNDPPPPPEPVPTIAQRRAKLENRIAELELQWQHNETHRDVIEKMLAWRRDALQNLIDPPEQFAQ